MSLHNVGIHEYGFPDIYSDYIVINNEQLTFLKWFFKHFLGKDGRPYNSNPCRYTFVEDDPDYMGDYWSPFTWNDYNKSKVIIFTEEFGFEFFTLTHNQIDMLEFLRDFLNDDYITFVNITEEKFPEIS